MDPQKGSELLEEETESFRRLEFQIRGPETVKVYSQIFKILHTLYVCALVLRQHSCENNDTNIIQIYIYIILDWKFRTKLIG